MPPEKEAPVSEQREIAQLKGEVHSIHTTLDRVGTTIDRMGTQMQELAGLVSRLDASQGRVPVGTIFGSAGFVAAIMAVIGTLTINPVRTELAELQTTNKNMVEQFVPSLTETLGILKEANREGEAERSLFWEQTFERLYEDGRRDETLDQHDRLLVSLQEDIKTRRSDSDDAQDVRLDAIQRELDRRYPLVYPPDTTTD